MKINKKEYLKNKKYFNKINDESLYDLDLSDFGINASKKEIDEWLFIGLYNTDFINMYLRLEEKKNQAEI